MSLSFLPVTALPLEISALPPANSIFQSALWARYKASCGQTPLAFTVKAGNQNIPLILFIRKGPGGIRYAYAADAPDIKTSEESFGPILEDLSIAISRQLPPDCAFIRWDTVQESPWQGPEYHSHTGQWKGAPRSAIREMRMNWGTRERRLRKAIADHLSPDTVIISLVEDEETILARMRQTTRNAIRRAQRSGICVRPLHQHELSQWYALYRETATRKGIYCEQESFFKQLAALPAEDNAEICFMGGFLDNELLAGAAFARAGSGAYYLFAGSSLHKRECMPNYGLQWEAIRWLKEHGCTQYDLLGVPPNNDPDHKMYGLYTFKTGFGGRHIHYSGCWDWPIDENAWKQARNAEILASAP